MNVQNYGLEELSYKEMEDIEGGFLMVAAAVVATVWALTGLYEWGYEYASRQYAK